MTTLGQEISALLSANGVPGKVVYLRGGPASLLVGYFTIDEDGRRQDGEITLSMEQPSVSAGPVQHGSIDQLVRDAKAGNIVDSPGHD